MRPGMSAHTSDRGVTMKGRTLLTAILLLVSVILAGCGGASTERTSEPAPTSPSRATETPVPTEAATREPGPATTPMPVPTRDQSAAPLSAAAVFASVSPAVPFIETPVSTGSGFLVEDGYVVTNAHVVWPFETVRVVFPDGSEFLDAPVVNWDLMGDLAVIGPFQTEIAPVPLVDAEELPIGSDVYLIGYPGEADPFPQPTISRGLVSRLRSWEPIEMTFFQTDAAAAGGQSGGVLVTEAGEVIGISSVFYTEGFVLAASAADVAPRVERLVALEDVAGLGDRRIPLAGGQREYDVTLQNFWDSRMFVINEAVGTTIEFEVTGENDGALSLLDAVGDIVVIADEGESGKEAETALIDWEAPYFLIVEQFSETPGEFELWCSHRLVPFTDMDDGIDYFGIDLSSGEQIEVTVDSLMIDPFVVVDFFGATEEEFVTDDDNGGGLFGLSARVVFEAPHSGSYFVAVRDSSGYDFGGYYLTVSPASP